MNGELFTIIGLIILIVSESFVLYLQKQYDKKDIQKQLEDYELRQKRIHKALYLQKLSQLQEFKRSQLQESSLNNEDNEGK